MTTADAPVVRPLRGAMITTWVIALAAGVSILLFSGENTRPLWIASTMGLVIPLAFTLQLAYGRANGFIVRTAVSVFGAFLVLAAVSIVALFLP